MYSSLRSSSGSSNIIQSRWDKLEGREGENFDHENYDNQLASKFVAWGVTNLHFLSFKDLHLLKLRSKCQKNGFGQLEKRRRCLELLLLSFLLLMLLPLLFMSLMHRVSLLIFLHYTGINTFNTSKKQLGIG